MLAGYGRHVPDDNYLDLIAGSWLDQLLHVAYAAREELLAGGSTPMLPAHQRPQRVAADLSAYVQFTAMHSFHAGLKATIACLLDGDGKAARQVPACELRISGPATGLKKRIATGILGTSRPAVLFCNPYPKCSLANWAAALWRWRRWARWDDLDLAFGLQIPIDTEWRRACSVGAGPVTDFDSLVRVLLPLQIPVALMEGLDDLRTMALRARTWRPKVLYTANALHCHLPFKLLAAEWHQAGTTLVCHQHGSGYGLDRHHTLEDYETSVVDKYYSWGWQRPDRPVTPLTPACVRPKHRPMKGILLVCCSFSSFVYRLHFHPMPGTLESVERNTSEFLAAMKGDADLTIRLNPANNGLQFRDRWQAVAPRAVFDDLREPMTKRFEQHRLIVHNHIGTALLEALAHDVPTVGFFDESTYAFRTEAQPLIEALERVGILHRSGVAAAAFVQGLAADISGWWHSAEVQDARSAFVHRHANFSYNWTSAWEEEFGRIAG
jgi:putative transferase (TIGR04331 family)